MKETTIDFESEGLSGVVPVGCYLVDAAKRIGVKLDGDCLTDEEGKHHCIMKVSKGRTLLSKPTKLEMELLSAAGRKSGERLACQTKIEKAGEMEVMSVKKKAEESEKKVEEKEAEYREEFKELPLEKKIASLVELEAIALGETFSFVLNSPYKAVGKVMDVMAEFGFKLEKEDREAKRPKDHKEPETKEGKPSAKKTAGKKTTASKRKPAAKKTTRKRAPKESTKKEE
ncbi:MAG: hypothetical protein HKN25_15355 [Pyrinomonadaceae bacterium]|nr:hypothetical protein [Pyrinomonadaceae bacterium]